MLAAAMTRDTMLKPFLDRLGARWAPFSGIDSSADFGDPDGECRALRQRAGLLVRPWAEVLVLTGADRQRFLGGLTTADVKALAPGSGAFGFITDRKGHLLADMVVLAAEDRLLLELPPGRSTAILEHLSHYRIADRVEIVADDAPLIATILGPGATSVLTEFLTMAPPDAPWAHRSHALLPTAVRVVRDCRWGVAAWSLWIDGEHRQVLAQLLAAGRGEGLMPVGWRALETLRIEAGWPRFGQDIDGGNFPQETGLEAEAVSYTKGCYLGQEVVARIHYRGGVQRRLCGLRFDRPAADPTGATLLLGERTVGTVTSFAMSETRGAIGLGVLHRSAEADAVVHATGIGEAHVVSLADRAQ